MTLSLHDTMAGEKRAFEPLDPSRVTLYACGPTVYNHAHIGNFRAAVVFDILFRLLRFHYGEKAVLYARNFTDVDDKIIAASREAGEPIDAITKKFAQIYQDETSALGNLAPSLEPRATDNIGAMIGMIETLVAREAAYAADGHVLFSVAAHESYGVLSRVDQEEILAGARVEVAPYKKDASDFVLWKPSADDEPGWDSPWGRGRPGWHIECSAMIAKIFGETIDIHGGGQDLRFPHHENECAQSACAHGGAPLARYWVHNGFLRMGADKRSKSLGNIVLVRDLLKEWPGEAIRWALLSAHYRQPLEWTDALLAQSKRQLDKFYRLFLDADRANAAPTELPAPPNSILLALNDDMNTPGAIAGLHEIRDIVAQTPEDRRPLAIARLKAAGALMGFFQADPEAWFKGDGADDGLSSEDIDALLIERATARAAKDFAAADAIRDKLSAAGIVIEDGPEGATWRRA
ncbi:MAG: cysteine--tRNA ligase [Pseudomonadota bacterium]